MTERTWEEVPVGAPWPPHNSEAEENLLGAMLLRPDAAAAAVEIVSADDFYRPRNRRIFTIIVDLIGRGEVADMVTVTDELARLQPDDAEPVDVLGLQAGTPGVAAVKSYAKVVAEHAYLRRLQRGFREGDEAVRQGDRDRAERILADMTLAGDVATAGHGFRRWTLAELLAEPATFAWLVKGLLADPTFGVLAGEMKTLKSYIALIVNVGVAAGRPVFDVFTPVAPRPVVVYVGEGGRLNWHRRLLRVAEAVGVDPSDLELHPRFDVAPLASAAFRSCLRRDLREIEPGLVSLDPLYAYHGIETRAQDLHQEGALLNRLSVPCVEAGATLMVVNHFNQTGYGRSLKRITQAGSGEWADTWMLVDHRKPPDVAAGRFRLTLDVGSRQWGGRTYDLDLDLGTFDDELGDHAGEIAWRIAPADVRSPEARSLAGGRDLVDAIRTVLNASPWALTKSAVREKVGGGRTRLDAAWGELVAKGEIESRRCRRDESGTTKTREVWGLVRTRAGDERRRSTEKGS